MISEKDKSVIDAYARTGMELDTLIASFPQFDRADVEAIYHNVHDTKSDTSDYDGKISINCS